MNIVLEIGISLVKILGDNVDIMLTHPLKMPHPTQPFGMLHASHSSPLELFLSLASITSRCLGFCPNDTGYSFSVTIVGSNSFRGIF